MPHIRFEFATVTLEAELLDTPTAKAILAAVPITSSALTWGEESFIGRTPKPGCLISPAWPGGRIDRDN